MDSPPSPPPSPVREKDSESTDDNIPIAYRPLFHRGGGSSLRRNIRTTPERSPGRIPQLIDEDIVDLEDDEEGVADAPAEDQWSDFDHDRIFRQVPRISATVWEASSGGQMCCRGRTPSRPSSPALLRRAARSPSVHTGGVCRDIPLYSSVMNDEVTSPSLREGNRGVAKSIPLNHDLEPERAFGESSEVGPTAPGGGESVVAEKGASVVAPSGGFMADAFRSAVRKSGSLKRPSEGVPSAVTDILDVDDLAHPQEFKDLARSDAQSNSQGLYEKDLKRVRAKLESFFAEKESCDARVRDLEFANPAAGSRACLGRCIRPVGEFRARGSVLGIEGMLGCLGRMASPCWKRSVV
ncbi:hypothetical protein Bca52824_001239 [Brassica carinata]|uniref:Uncharacterized protein n=1 Tax=Brassica carinata TaxID=52824 RepID=A0A8X7WFX0_BRACI|nr:hypothetical protein Bca52824_001239 [Brassica carinata]